jgi:hypothetical protein
MLIAAFLESDLVESRTCVRLAIAPRGTGGVGCESRCRFFPLGRVVNAGSRQGEAGQRQPAALLDVVSAKLYWRRAMAVRRCRC